MLKMANADTCMAATFTFIWTIENISELTYIDLESPSFVVKSMGNAKWFMKINEYAGFYCEIQTYDSSEKVRDGIDFEFSILDADGSPLISKRSREPRFCLSLFTIDAFFKKWAEFMPNNVLTIQCRMWEKENKIPTTDLCFARTKLRTYYETFQWAIEEFSALKSSAVKDFRELASTEKKVYSLKPLMEKGPYMALILFLKKSSNSEDVHVNFLIEKGRDYAFSCEISALDANGQANFQAIHAVKAHNEELSAVKFSNSGDWLASCSWEPVINLWTIDDDHFHLRTYLRGHKMGVSDVAFSSDNSQLASASDDKTVKIWDICNAKCIRTFTGHSNFVFCITFRGDLILSGSDDKTAKLWDKRIGECIRNIQYHSERVTSVDFSQRNNTMLTSSMDHTCAFHEFRTTKLVDFFVESDAVSYAKFIGSGKRVTVSTHDSVIKLWDCSKRRVVKKYEGHLNATYSVFSHISHANSFIASGSEDQSIYLWYPKSEEIAQVLEGHEDAVLSVQFHPQNEAILVSGCLGKTMTLYKNIATDD
ncbi:WD repeat-containing protein 5-like [Argiope bruennichi]|uniref:WD repeat-containing protein 5-like n=1 Tax=Argiope bruennichi TaxID=94029 RepID=UPI0024959612|nr:WD repeat-containing protein 5-like [Argiope bruennichi]